MNDALAWIGELVGWFGQFIPRWVIIITTHRGVKFVRGSKIKVLTPGVHWYWPATTELITYPAARQSIDLRPQILTTSDSITIAVSGLIVYEVTDIEALIAYTTDPDNTVGEIALTAIQDVMDGMSWQEIQKGDRRKLKVRLRRAAAKALKPYGVRVLKFDLTDLAPCRVLRFLGDTTAALGAATHDE